MNARNLIILALVLGSISAYSVSRWIGIGGSAGHKVMLATSTIAPGAAITADKLKAFNWPSNDVPPGSFSKVKEVQGRITRQEILKGEPILEYKLAGIESKGGLESTITTGKRAITVRVNEVIAVAGFAHPGSFIDVIVNVKDSATNLSFSKTVLNRVKVLAVAQEISADPNKPKVVNAVTLELTPKESEALDLSRNIGSLSLVLRNEYDTSSDATSGTKYDDIFGTTATKDKPVQPVEVQSTPVQVAKAAVPKQKHPASSKKLTPAPHKVEVIRGNNISEVGF